MEFTELISKRVSVRGYKPDPVPEAVLNRVLDAARMAPSAKNKQSYRLFVIPTEGRQEVMARLYSREFLRQAPLIIGIVAVPDGAWVRKFDDKNHAHFDAIIAFDHLVLAATNENLGTCWVCLFDPTVAKELLPLEPGWEPIAFTPLGYPDDAGVPKTRKSLDDLVIRM